MCQDWKEHQFVWLYYVYVIFSQIFSQKKKCHFKKQTLAFSRD